MTKHNTRNKIWKIGVADEEWKIIICNRDIKEYLDRVGEIQFALLKPIDRATKEEFLSACRSTKNLHYIIYLCCSPGYNIEELTMAEIVQSLDSSIRSARFSRKM